jgi:hypothetical protein
MPWMFTVLEDTHAFVIGSIRGWGDETRVRFGKEVGVTLGTFNFNTGGIGLDAFQYVGVPLVREAPGGAPFGVFLLFPTLDVRGYVGPGRWGAAVGTSVTGLRFANCALTGCFEVGLRVLTIDLWGVGDFNQASFAVSLGGGLTAGIKL